ncbi:MAG: SpoIIE family protein phosphatase [Leptospiraceae bacterium]|nr:SpoIIE family protein phosphatase [Leptospiraceae bacterium]MCB1303964.1 SpoIIE family protein phosphatase [Leptospiraceae bacterium]
MKELSGFHYDLPSEDDPAVDVYELYRQYPDLQFLPVSGGKDSIVGYTLRNQFLAILSKNHYSRELMLRPDVKLQSMMRPDPVILDAYATLSEASTVLMNRPEESRFDPFVVTLEGKFYGISTVDLILKGMNSFLRRDNEACLEAQFSLLKMPSPAREVDFPAAQDLNGLRFHRFVQPLSGPGGDFVQIYPVNDQLTLFFLFDVCGKGLKASAMVSIIGTALETLMRKATERRSMDSRSITPLLQQLNDITCSLSPQEMYATGIVGAVDHSKEVLALYDFGHGMCWMARSFKPHRLERSAIGSADQAPFFGIHPDLEIRPVYYRWKKGDLLFACSDGIVEQRDGAGRMFGAERVEELLARTLPEPAKVNREILHYWENFREDCRVADDLSLLSVQFESLRT